MGQGYKIGVDLGTKNTIVYVGGKGIIYNEPTVVAFDQESKKPIAIGHSASEMLGKEHKKVKVVKPLDGGVISNLEATKIILSFIFNKIQEDGNGDIKKSTLLICCPCDMTSTEREALEKLGTELNIKDVFVEQEIKAGAIGAGVDIFTAKGSLVIDIGGGSTDVGVLSLGDLVIAESIRKAGQYIDNEIIKYVKVHYGMIIGERTAEQIKINLGTLRKDIEEDKEYSFAGRSLENNLPRRKTIKQSEIRNILVRIFDSISTKVINVLQGTPPELAADILENGIVINGGGALIDGVEEYFETVTGITTYISKYPLTSIAEGGKTLLKNRGNYLVKPID
ncbi:rod shape-determining protein [Haloplasma contractile]|uniref:Cell shape-determining protein MreB n=1 Tax=Haloplasma contractile SSD-17B TaxID=1033810 RepID=U2E951_9MOLU|nr:rod shape-determining protein [Haloplasma contractile]ERJ11668.1 dihydrolipoamide dehydrogenase protein [Haloplasma contractile SSD-17B]